ncbi:Uncharacterised protein [Staphylococcus intermedius NCTC 11048]|uniref:Uncharacterized protein n=1 Tax=Staphylococcus intermedius NCTC 11048 TaxID=1141106 RepID=A0A380G8B5_STAIN|nr:Uncharacterised protein [Staphylococcus intermedius NCTC 11048]
MTYHFALQFEKRYNKRNKMDDMGIETKLTRQSRGIYFKLNGKLLHKGIIYFYDMT